MKKYLFLLVSLSFLLFSCNETDLELPTEPTEDEVTILKERDPNFPWKPTIRPSISTKSTKSMLTFNDFLGRSFKSEAYPLENGENLGHPVIDVNKLKMDNPSYFSSWRIGTGFAQAFSYSAFSRYESNSNITKKVDNGFNLNLPVFGFGAKKNITEVFTQKKVEDTKSVFGELVIATKAHGYRMQTSSLIKNKILQGYLSKEFKEELYNTTPSEFYSNYGAFVLTNFITGGKAVAIYNGLYKKDELAETKEKNMNKEISVSYGPKTEETPDPIASGNLGIGKNYSNGTTSTNEFTNLEITVKTIGGSSEFASFSSPKDINSINVNLSGWASSLSDASTHSIVEIADKGLIPITEFIPEFNLRRAIIREMEKDPSKNYNITKMQEPYIEMYSPRFLGPHFECAIYLHTRFGDALILRIDIIKTIDRETYIKHETERYSNMFGVEVRRTGYARKSTQEVEGLDGQKYVLVKEEKWKKFTHNGSIYIVSDYIPHGDPNNEDLVWGAYHAYVIHDDRVLDEYAMRPLVNRLPTINNIDFNAFLKKYRIYAL